jgi:small subunit ribosomal protein S16
MDVRTPRDGKVIEELGIYDPLVPETDARAVLNGERIDYWLSVGAQPTPKVNTLIKKYGSQGTHLGQQQEAMQRIGQKRTKSIEAARIAASKVPMPKIKPDAPSSSAESDTESQADAGPITKLEDQVTKIEPPLDGEN